MNGEKAPDSWRQTEIIVILKPGKDPEEGRRHHLHFLNALCRVCGAHGRGGRATLPFPKEAVALKVKEIMKDSFFSIEPRFLLAMRAVGELRVCGRKEEGLHRMLLAFLREDPSAGDFFTLLDDPMPEVSLSATSELLASPLEQNTAKEPPARSKASSPPWGRGGFREPVQSSLGFSGPLEIVAVLLVDPTS
ncbi:UNVERIFIED_CONTAM: hypothetical protein K2H54_032741 [Gekko kuhli]